MVARPASAGVMAPARALIDPDDEEDRREEGWRGRRRYTLMREPQLLLPCVYLDACGSPAYYVHRCSEPAHAADRTEITAAQLRQRPGTPEGPRPARRVAGTYGPLIDCCELL